MGIQDAYNLGWKLAAVANGASPALLDTYEAERRPVAAHHVLALSDARLKRTLEHNSIPIRRDTSTIQLDVSYRGSDLARNDRDESAPLRAGDRAPDATRLTTVEGERRLFDLTRGERFTLLSFGAVAAVGASRFDFRTLHVVEQPAGPDDIADTGGHLASTYGATGRTLVLIRPDGYIALISDTGDVTAVSEYLAAVG